MLITALIELYTKLQKEFKLKDKLIVCLGICMYGTVGVIVFNNVFELSSNNDTPLNYVDALYFSLVTISTVGYGDLSPGPDSPGLQTFTIFYIFGGVILVFPQLAGLMNGVLQSFRERTPITVSMPHHATFSAPRCPIL